MMVIQWSHRDFSKPCCGKGFSKSSCETSVQHSPGNKNEKRREIQPLKLGIFSFNSYLYYLTHDFIASTRVFNLQTHAFNLLTGAFSLRNFDYNLGTRAFSVLTHGFELLTCGFELVTRKFEHVTRRFELVTCGFELGSR